MQQLQHPNILPLLAHSRAMAPMDADQGLQTFYMLFPLYKVDCASNIDAWPRITTYTNKQSPSRGP